MRESALSAGPWQIVLFAPAQSIFTIRVATGSRWKFAFAQFRARMVKLLVRSRSSVTTPGKGPCARRATELAKLAFLDPTSQVANRRYLDQQLSQHLDQHSK